MPGSSALEILLRSLRRQKDEVQLTRCLVELSNADDGVGGGLACALLQGAANNPVTGDRAAKLLEALPRECLWRAEEKAVGDPHRIGLRRRAERGRIDWLLEGDGNDDEHPRFLLGVEVKVDAPLAEGQLRKYYEDLGRRGAETWGLLVLARNRPSEAELLDPSRDEHWLGVALWRDVIASSLAVEPADDALSAVWPAFLSVLAADDDLGAAPIVVSDLAGEERGAKLSIVVEHARSPVEETIRRELKARLGRRARPDLVDVKFKSWLDQTKRAAELNCYLDPDDASPALTLDLLVEGGVPRLVSRVQPAKFWLARTKTQDVRAGAERLQGLQPTFRNDGDDYVRERELPLVEGDLRDVVADAMTDEIRQVIGTGIFDHDV